MLIGAYDRKNNFRSVFDTETGFYARTGVLDENGKVTNIDPFMTAYPSLIDIGIQGHCLNGSRGLCKQAGVYCYQSGGKIQMPNMLFEDYKKIIDESKGKTFEVALGGRGDPDQHENFQEIIEYTVANNIVPNFTTSGICFDQSKVDICKGKCGAIAVSFYRNEHTYNAINLLTKSGITTNIHYVLGNNSIDEAIDKLKNDSFPKGINAVIFLLHKPVGLATKENCLNINDPKVTEFFNCIDNCKVSFKIGFDSCSIPGILNKCSSVNLMSVDTCEGGRWSMYISADMVALHCSFDQSHRWGYNIKNDSIKNAWESSQFESFRQHFKMSCPNCSKRNECMGGCPIVPEVVLCSNKDREQK